MCRKSRTALLPRYLEALQQEIAHYRRHPFFAGKTLTSIYWGGGTPSLIPPEQIHALLGEIRSGWEITPSAEITLEANPGALDCAHLAGYRQAGINRLSLGIQSFHDRELALLTRIHSAAGAMEALTAARAVGFTNLSLDLIFGLPGQYLSDYKASLSQALAFGPEHL
ncbi:MAG TPA: radical SAM protein, partial [bacterium]|nr:radical SAM protein [bacterium]